MFVDLRRERVLLLRHVAEFFEQRQIAVRLDVALRAGIAVPVPGAAEVAARFDDAEVGETRLAKARARQQATKAAADDHDVDFVGERFACEPRLHVRIVDEVRELAGDLYILVVALRTHTLVAFLPVFLA